MVFCVCVGHTVVGGFNNAIGARKCIRRLAPGCKPQIKKCHPIQREERVAKHRSNEAQRGQITAVETYNPTTGMSKKIRLIRPGEFRL